MTSLTAVQHHTRSWGNIRHGGCAADWWPTASLFNPRFRPTRAVREGRPVKTPCLHARHDGKLSFPIQWKVTVDRLAAARSRRGYDLPTRSSELRGRLLHQKNPGPGVADHGAPAALRKHGYDLIRKCECEASLAIMRPRLAPRSR
jgi:hypothetical protein